MTVKRKPLPKRPHEEQIVRPIRVEPTEYVVTSLAEDDIDWSVWQLRICWRGDGRWAVMRFGYQCWGADGEWDHEPQPSSRTEEWLATHRFTYEETRRIAVREFPKLVINGWRVENGKLVKA